MIQGPLSEGEPNVRLTINGETLDMTRRRGSLFTFMGRVTLSDGTEIDAENVNHVFVEHERTAAGRIGTYIFSHNPVFDQLSDYMMENGYPLHLNLLDVAECDRQAYETALARESNDIDRGIPDDWS